MNEEVAQMVLMTSRRASAALGELVPLLTAYGDVEKDERVKLAIASAIYEIGLIDNAIFDQHSRLKAEFEARLSKYGRSFY